MTEIAERIASSVYVRNLREERRETLVGFVDDFLIFGGEISRGGAFGEVRAARWRLSSPPGMPQHRRAKAHPFMGLAVRRSTLTISLNPSRRAMIVVGAA